MPSDIKLHIVEMLERIQDVLMLCMTHSSMVHACQSRMFRTIEVCKSTNAQLSARLSDGALARIQHHVLRLRLNYSYVDSSSVPTALKAATMDAFLTSRDILFAQLVQSLSQLRAITIVLHQFAPFSTAVVESKLDRSSLIRLAQLLRLETLKIVHITFGYTSSATSDQRIWSGAILKCFVSNLSLSGITHLAMANLHLVGSDDRIEQQRRLLHSLFATLVHLEGLVLDNVDLPTTFLVQNLPKSLRSLEILDDGRHYDASNLLQQLSTSQHPLHHLRIAAFDRTFDSTDTEEIVLPHLRSLILQQLSSMSSSVSRWIGNVNRLMLRLRAVQLAHIHYLQPPKLQRWLAGLPNQCGELLANLKRCSGFPQLRSVMIVDSRLQQISPAIPNWYDWQSTTYSIEFCDTVRLQDWQFAKISAQLK